MILVFGGTTEGRKAVEVLEEAGTPYYYSTKTGEQDIVLHHGIRQDGALDAEAMQLFCREHEIRLIVDAAHPFASRLHETIAQTSEKLSIPIIRYERIYPLRNPAFTWIDDYSQVPTDIHTLLATTGVQSISQLKYLESWGVKVIYRILNRESSIQLAHQQGATDEQLCFYPDTVAADAILMKESGLSGGFVEKVAEAQAQSMRIIVLKRPPLLFTTTINGPYGLRRAVEKLLPEFFPLHSGLTTGTCATAAAMAATIRLLKNETPAEVPVLLPDGETISVPVGYADGYAYCIKESGDDPDVTNGLEIRAACRPINRPSDKPTNRPTPYPFFASRSATIGDACQSKKASQAPSALYGGEWLVFEGGEGVGRFTLPGFDFPPGEPAINKGPREMIRKNLADLITPLHLGRGWGWVCRFSVPEGEEIARRTFNPRLGIEGGISIIGVSGIVKPFSEEAFIDSIRKCMEVAKASGSERVVINSGGKSERFVKALYPDLPQQAFVEYGNYIGKTLTMAHELDFRHVTLGVMLGKAVKLAAGHLDTHSRKTVMDKAFIQQMLQESGISIDISDMTLARELWERIPECGRIPFARVVISHCAEHCDPLLPHGELTILLIGDDGTIHSL